MARKSNGEGSIRQIERDGKAYYVGTITLRMVEGKAIRKSFGGKKKSDVVRKMQEAKVNSDKYNNKSNLTFEEYFLDWITNYKINDVSKSTYYRYETVYRTRLEGTKLGRTKLNNLSLEILQEYFNQVYIDTGGNTVINKCYTFINTCLNRALAEGYIPTNFCKAVTLPNRLEERTKEKNKIKAFTREQQELFESCLCFDLKSHALFYFILYTGLRRGEAVAVKWDDIDEDNNLHVSRQIQYVPKLINGKTVGWENVIKAPKTRAGVRIVPLPDKIVTFLKTLDHQSDYIFHNKGKPIDARPAQVQFNKYCKALGLEGFTIHSLRHTYATRLFELGERAKTVQHLLGHTNIAVTLDTYTHVLSDSKESAREKLNLL